MEKLILKGSERSPYISLDPVSGVFEISGTSIPEDCLLFYKQIFDWLDQYKEMPAYETTIHVKLKFFNTSSSKCLYNIFKKLDTLYKQGKKATVVWYYYFEDTDMYESGQDYQNLLSIPFRIEKLDKQPG